MNKRKSETEWRVIRLRSKGEYLGAVAGADEATALKAALKLFKVEPADAGSLLLRPYE
jgi:hypothetical protein